MKIYTKKGDKGTTQLIGGTRVPKHHFRIEVYGTLDELLSHVGLVRDIVTDETLKKELIAIQNNLFTIGSFIAVDPEKETLANGQPRLDIPDITLKDIEDLEKAIDRMNAELPPLQAFILPGGHMFVSFCHLARVICRKAERKMTALHEQSPLNPLYLQYINRLSDYLFVLARKLSKDLQAEEIPWKPER